MPTSIIPVLGLAALTVLLQPGSASGQAAEASTADAIVSCVAANLPQGDELRSITLETRDRAGAERVTQAEVFTRWTSATSRRILVTFRAPPELERSGLLVLDEDGDREVWIHSPELGRRRIETGEAAAQGLFGTGISYEDLLHLMGVVRIESGKLRRLDDDRIGDHPTYVMESIPEPGATSYARVVTAVDKETCVPLEVKLYERIGTAPRKVIRVDPEQIFEVNGTQIAHSATLWDYRDGKRTTLRVSSVVPDLADVPDELWSPDDLGELEPVVAVDVKVTRIEKPELIPQ